MTALVDALHERRDAPFRSPDIIYEIEEMFDVEVPNDNLDGLKTVQDIVYGVSELIAVKG